MPLRPLSFALTLVVVTAACQPLRGGLAATGGDARLDASRVDEPSWRTIGTSRGGLSIEAQTLGSGTRRVALIASIHGDEGEGRRHLDAFLPILAGPNARVLLIRDCNPDGSAASRRTTKTGVDPNRNWPARNFRRDPRNGPDPLSEPGVAATYRALTEFEPDLVIVLHSTSRGPFVNYDGPGEVPARAFARAAGTQWSVQPSMGYPTPGSIGSYFGVDRGIPILTIEFRRGAPASETGPPLLRGLRGLLGNATDAEDDSPFRVR